MTFIMFNVLFYFFSVLQNIIVNTSFYKNKWLSKSYHSRIHNRLVPKSIKSEIQAFLPHSTGETSCITEKTIRACTIHEKTNN